jgi:hypothetical protein
VDLAGLDFQIRAAQGSDAAVVLPDILGDQSHFALLA